MTLRRTPTTIIAMALLLGACGGGDAKPTATTTATTTTSGACTPSSAPADQTITYTFTHNAATQGLDSHRDSAFSHLAGLNVETPADNTEAMTFTISVLDGAVIATISEVGPGMTCGIDHDFAEGEYFILSSDGNGTQFSSAAP